MCKATVEKCMKFIETSAKRGEFKNCITTFEREGIAYCTDGYQVLRTLEEIDESKFKEATDQFMDRCEKLFDDNYLGECKPFEMPDAKELESRIKNLKSECKSKSRPLWKVQLGYALDTNFMVNAEFLLNALKATGESTAYGAEKYSPLIFLGENTQYAILPMYNTGDLTAGELRILH